MQDAAHRGTGHIVVPIKQGSIPLAGYRIPAVQLPDGRVALALRPLCEALRLDPAHQLRRIREDPLLAGELVQARVTGTANARAMLMLGADALPRWLASPDQSRVSARKRSARERVALALQHTAHSALDIPSELGPAPEEQSRRARGTLPLASAPALIAEAPARTTVETAHASTGLARQADDIASDVADAPTLVVPRAVPGPSADTGAWQHSLQQIEHIFRLPFPRRTRSGRGSKQGKPHVRRRLAIAVSVLLLVSILVVQLNGVFGGWLADEMRAIIGPQATAQVESWFLGVQDTFHQVQYHLFGGSNSTPWTGASGTPPPAQPHEMALTPIAPMIQPALPGEGVWSTQGLPPPGPGQPPLVARAFIRPDPSRPYGLVTLLQFDLRSLSLHLVAGTTEPGGPLGHDGPGVIPTADQQGNTLIAAFNGGFKYADGQYGLMSRGTVYVPPQPNAATIAIPANGQVFIDAWGRNPQLSLTNRNLLAWRQNAALLIDNGQINPLTSDGAAWGGVWLNKAATWRSGLGITRQGTLLYAAGASLTAATLGTALQAAGAVMAMQTDINPLWVRAFLYERTTDGALQITKLNPGMQGTGQEYLQSTARDFFYLTRNPITPARTPAQTPTPTRTPRTSGP